MARFTPTHEPPDFPDEELLPEEPAPTGRQLLRMFLPVAAAIVVFHNHPSGDPTPSPDDVNLTRRLAAAGALLGIDVVDHMILGETRYYSFKETRTL